jgi:EmrB/QacA subfamily drug resistance transporter
LADVAVAEPTHSTPIEAHVWRIAAVVVLGSIMSILDTTIVNVALDTLGRDLHSPLSDIQWVITGYMLSLAAVIPLTGWSARRFGAKQVYVVALVAFTVGSVLCGLSNSVAMLTLFRVLQGFGGGLLMPVGLLMMASAAGPQRMGRVMSITSIPTMVAPILGPMVGGLIVDNASWRWIFFVNVPVGIIALFAALRFLPHSDRAEAQPLDVRGLLLLSTGLPLLTYGLAEIGSTGKFLIPQVVFPILVGAALIVAFVFHALHKRFPLLDVRLYRRPTFAAASSVMFAMGGAVFGGMILMPLYLQQVRGLSAFETGLLLAPMGVGMILVLPLLGRQVDRHGGGQFALAGLIVTAVATIPFAFVGPNTSYWLLSAVMVVRGIGSGATFMPAMTAAFASLKRDELPDASPQINVVMRVGGSLGTALLAVVLQRAFISEPTPSDAFDVAFWWTVGLTAIAILPAVVLWRAERAARRQAAAEAEPVAIPIEQLAESAA